MSSEKSEALTTITESVLAAHCKELFTPSRPDDSWVVRMLMREAISPENTTSSRISAIWKLAELSGDFLRDEKAKKVGETDAVIPNQISKAEIIIELQRRRAARKLTAEPDSGA